MANERWCRHYRALADYTTCEKGIPFASVKVDRGKHSASRQWPCVDPDVRYACPAFEGYTAAEVEAEEQWIADFVTRHNALFSRDSDICPHCGKQVAALEQVVGSVYARPCGCRQGRGRVPAVWLQEPQS